MCQGNSIPVTSISVGVVLLCSIFNALPLNSLMKEQVWKRLEPWLLPVKVFDKNHGTSLHMEQN